MSALETVDLVIIHAATSQHFELAKRYLSAGVPVLMDKPVSEKLAEVKELQKIADQNNTLFVVAFNRRFAPQTAKLKALPDKNSPLSHIQIYNVCELLQLFPTDENTK